MNINDLKESKYLKKTDVEPPILVTIARITQENLAQQGQEPEMKYVLHFAEDLKPMVLNSTNGQLIAMVLGSEETDDWNGKQIVLYNDPNVSFAGKLTGGIRARAKKTQTVETENPAPVAAPAGDFDDLEDVPF